ncbi:rhomboid family protein [Ornithinibacillus halophilus]|uniref:Rhomboid family peptidase. Serine peptidase. MEROPS family S54 n=1 Tax=Ornithinibacillus halophilus TaxID=930117 RepID=A0A1M5D2A4_9BACI|nr:rhomboid family intramembrane serine protease [Ornithinibacillus halophilus]SHF61054.1 rhomboid family peptidase. Serine peptidase. MEROPS family S54 [Ornithinibacillus halophilus]
MVLKEQYKAFALATQLAEHENFNVLSMNEKTKEIWLEKYNNKVSTVIRIVNRQFDWKNHLKQDVGLFFQKVKTMKKLFRGKIELHNVYIAQNAPVDDWEVLKKTLRLKEKTPITMNVYYLEETNFNDELARFQNAVNVSDKKTIDIEKSELEMEYANQSNKQYLTKLLHDRRKEYKQVFTFGKPIFTYILLAINVLVFFLLEISGGSQNTENLIQFGAKYNPAIINGEWWRLFSAMFLHIGFFHLLMNMLAIYYLGNLIEKIYGSWRFLIIYFLAGLGGSLASFALTENVSAGASGALFGLFGALLFFGMVYKDIFFQTMGNNVIILLIINTVFGFVVPQVDAWAHMGGLAAGFLGAFIVHLPKKKDGLKQIIATILFVVLVGVVLVYGIDKNENSPLVQLTFIEEYIEQNKYEEIVERANIGLENPGEFEAILLFQRSYGYIGLNDVELAIEDLEKSIEIQDRENRIPESYYNLALLYNRTDNPKAVELIEKAYQLKPNNESYQKLYDEITNRDF